MKLTQIMLAASVLASQGTVAGAAAQDAAYDRAVAAVAERVAAIDSLGDFSPGRVIVMVRNGAAPIVDAKGMTRAEGGEPVDADTPFYIASMTKAFVGLLAVRLDSQGILPLETTLGEAFPEMRVAGVDLEALTMRRLLSHQVGFRAQPLNIRTAYSDLVPIDEYGAIVNAAGEPTGESFRYDNLGYVLYSAVLERRTDRSWRAWMDDLIFDPLGMQHSSARGSDFAEVAHLHMRNGEGLAQYPPKPDEVMHAAGGLFISGADMGRWLHANVGGPSSIPAQEIAAAQDVQVKLDMDQPPFRCTGYSFGWRRCEGFGLTVLEHGGSYTGMRAQMAVVPEKGIGFAALFNSDSMTGGLSGRLMQVFLMAYAGMADRLPPPGDFAASYAEQVEELGANRDRELAELRGDERWGGWDWRPSAGELAALTGTYVNPAFGKLEIGLEDDALKGRLNGTPLSLEPATQDLFATVLSTDYDVEPLRFKPAEEVVEYLDQRFMRQPK